MAILQLVISGFAHTLHSIMKASKGPSFCLSQVGMDEERSMELLQQWILFTVLWLLEAVKTMLDMVLILQEFET